MKHIAIPAFVLLAAATSAQAETPVLGGAIGSAYFASQVQGAQQENKGGYARSIEQAFTGKDFGVGGPPRPRVAADQTPDSAKDADAKK